MTDLVDRDGVILFSDFLKSDSAEDLMPPLNLYAGRNTSVFALTEFEPSRTSQEFAEESDINNIMARYIKTGTIPVYADRMMLDGDMHEMTFHEMQNVIANATSSFMQLPAVIRERFDNDPAKFVDFASEKGNQDQLREWGMLSPEAIDRLDAAKAAEVAEAAEKPPSDLSKPGKPGSTKPEAESTQ
nr:MAG: internal scaffolding protein [Microvirus sp.]